MRTSGPQSRSFHSAQHVSGSRIVLAEEHCISTVPDGVTQHVVAIPASRITSLYVVEEFETNLAVRRLEREELKCSRRSLHGERCGISV